MTEAVRPTKKQRQLLDFIEKFIKENGYSPSYREIMNGCDYTSVATVALHVNSLIKRGHLIKRDHSARSIEVVKQDVKAVSSDDSHELWLVRRVEEHLKNDQLGEGLSAESRVLLDALRVLGLDASIDKIAQNHPLVAEISPVQ